MHKAECQKANDKHIAYKRKRGLSAILSVCLKVTKKGCHKVLKWCLKGTLYMLLSIFPLLKGKHKALLR